MTVAWLRWIPLALTCGCLRFGYEPRVDARPDASQLDASVASGGDGALADAAPDGGVGGSGGSGGRNAGGKGGDVARPGAGAGGAGSSAAGGGASNDAGVKVEQMLGDTGLRVSDILGFYSGDWGDMLLRQYDAEVWGVYEQSGGTFVGQIGSDGVFVGWWTQLPWREGTNAGEVEFRWSATSGGTIALDGRWRYGTIGLWLENWDVNLVTDRAAPSALSAGFDNPEDFRRHP